MFNFNGRPTPTSAEERHIQLFSSFAIGLYVCHISFNKFVGIIDWISSIDRSYSCTVQDALSFFNLPSPHKKGLY